MVSQVPQFKKKKFCSVIYVVHGAKGTVKDSHILQTMTVYAATDNKLMYVCACGFYLIFQENAFYMVK